MMKEGVTNQATQATSCSCITTQCDQMARLFVQYLAIYRNGNQPNSIFWPNMFKIGLSTKIHYYKIIAKYFENIAKLAKFRKIWSHWYSMEIFSNYESAYSSFDQLCLMKGQLVSHSKLVGAKVFSIVNHCVKI